MRTKLVVNATAGRGHAGKILDKVQTCLAGCGVDYDLLRTEAPGHAIDLAHQGAASGYERVVAMGGDGTAYEVTNGLLLDAEEGHQAMLGMFPA